MDTLTDNAIYESAHSQNAHGELPEVRKEVGNYQSGAHYHSVHYLLTSRHQGARSKLKVYNREGATSNVYLIVIKTYRLRVTFNFTRYTHSPGLHTSYNQGTVFQNEDVPW